MTAMQDANPEVQLQGIEFWSNVCDNEINLINDMEEAQRNKRVPEEQCFFYTRGALDQLVPLVLQLMTTASEDDDTDDWTVSKAAAVCLDLLSACVRDDILPLVVPFISEYAHNPEWQLRDAAVQAFAAILDGPSPSNLNPLVSNALMPLLALIHDPQPQVKDSLAWALGRICDLIPDAIINDTYLGHVVAALLEGLSMEPRVADNVCWAFNAMAEAAYRMADPHLGQPASYALSGYFSSILYVFSVYYLLVCSFSGCLFLFLHTLIWTALQVQAV